uniref:Uncharacterized protein n=1 Tax=Anguilla anguilla TaxID=7936 RepID=A0A0E9WHY0_ANGAN
MHHYLQNTQQAHEKHHIAESGKGAWLSVTY